MRLSRLTRTALTTALIAVAAAPAAVAATPTGAVTSADLPAPTAHKTRVIGGSTPASGDMWPWMMSIQYAQNGGWRPWCGGSLVTPTVVLTAAHCVTDDSGATLSPGAFRIVAGRQDLRTTAGEEVGVSQILVHPSYDARTIRHDVALVRLQRPLGHQRAVLLDPSVGIPAGTVARVTGWGQTDRDDDASGSPVLKGLNVAVWGDADCAQAYAGFSTAYDPSTMLCGYSGTTEHATCRGDSGSPLMVQDPTHGWLQVGLVSWGEDCSRNGRPSVFAWTHSRTMTDWIIANSGTLSANTPVAGPTGPTGDAASGEIADGTTSDAAAPAPSVDAAIVRMRARRFTLRVTSATDARATITVRDARGRGVRTHVREVAAGTTRITLPAGARRGARISVRVVVADASGATASDTTRRVRVR